MEQGEDESNLRKVLGKGKNLLRAGILAGALIGSRGNANADKTYDPEGVPDSAYTQLDNNLNLDNQIVVPELAKDEEIKSPEEFSDVEFVEFTSGLQSGFETPENLIIRDQQTLDEYWGKINHDPNIPTPILKQDEIIVISALGNKDTLTATLITKVVKSDKSIRVDSQSYDIGQDIPEKSSPFDAILIKDVNLNLPFTFNTTQMPGKYNFNVAVSSKTDGEGNSQYSGTTISVEPRE